MLPSGAELPPSDGVSHCPCDEVRSSAVELPVMKSPKGSAEAALVVSTAAGASGKETVSKYYKQSVPTVTRELSDNNSN